MASSAKEGSADAPPALPSAEPFDVSGCVHPQVVATCSGGFCEIPRGCFVKGSPESEPGHGVLREQRVAVTLTRSFLIQEHEATQAEWVGAGLPNPSGGGPDASAACRDPSCPVDNVTWFEAVAFANLLSERQKPALAACYQLSGCTGELGKGMKCSGVTLKSPTVYECKGFRLPTDAEWEYAARAGTRTAFYTGDAAAIGDPLAGECYADPNLLPIAWYCHNSGAKVHPVGLLARNGFGLYDMLGNAMEWVNDVSTGLPPDEAIDPAKAIGTSAARIDRGGAFNLWATACRAARQSTASWQMRSPGLGFRLVRTLD